MENYYLAKRILPDGRHLAVINLTYGRARIVLSEHASADFYLDGW